MSRDDTALASDYSSWIASLHLGEGRVADALSEYEAAEADEPSNVYHKLNTCRLTCGWLVRPDTGAPITQPLLHGT